MKFSLEGKVVVVTGATSGIGKSAAVELAKQGAKVVVSGRRAPEGEAVVAQIVADGGEAVFIRADVSSEADVQALFESTVKQFGKLDSVFLNSGVFNFASIEDQQGADLAHQLNVNVQGVFYGLQQASKHLNKGGSILVNTSVVAERTMPNALAYSLTKAAANSLVRSAAIELAPRGIRVNAVAPGPIFTEGSSAMAGGREGVDAYMAPMVPLGRVGEPIEIAAAVVFLTSDEASFITGQILGVDGGIGAK